MSNYVDQMATRTAERLAAEFRPTTEHTRGESHVKVLLKPGGRAEQIVTHLTGMMGMTRAQLSADLGILQSSLCGRLNELVASGHVVVGPTVWNLLTERNVVTYWVIPDGEDPIEHFARYGM